MAVEQVSLESWISERGGDVFLEILVVTRSSRIRIMGLQDARLKVQLKAAPVKGQANQELERFLAKEIGIAKAQVQVVSGATGRRKTVRISGVAKAKVYLALR